MTMRGSSGCRTAALTAAFGLVGAPASAQALDHLFKSCEEGYRCFRIPAIVATASSTLLVIAEGRKTGGGSPSPGSGRRAGVPPPHTPQTRDGRSCGVMPGKPRHPHRMSTSPGRCVEAGWQRRDSRRALRVTSYDA